MEGPDLSAPQDTPYGLLSPPLGQARLKAVEVLYSILSLSDPAAEQGALFFMQHLDAEWLSWVKQWDIWLTPETLHSIAHTLDVVCLLSDPAV